MGIGGSGDSPEVDKRKAYMSSIKNDFYKSEEERIKAEQSAKLAAFKDKSAEIEAAKKKQRAEEDAKARQDAENDLKRMETNKKMKLGENDNDDDSMLDLHFERTVEL